MFLDRDTKAEELLVLVVGIHNGLLNQSVQLSVAPSGHVRQPTEMARRGDKGREHRHMRWSPFPPPVPSGKSALRRGSKMYRTRISRPRARTRRQTLAFRGFIFLDGGGTCSPARWRTGICGRRTESA